ncbi:hypothetical protein Q3G72_002296 [Acer saccharum]|nr:hypothetical protein Q3G72_002296 [Acer saccharum]
MARREKTTPEKTEHAGAPLFFDQRGDVAKRSSHRRRRSYAQWHCRGDVKKALTFSEYKKALGKDVQGSWERTDR